MGDLDAHSQGLSARTNGTFDPVCGQRVHLNLGHGQADRGGPHVSQCAADPHRAPNPAGVIRMPAAMTREPDPRQRAELERQASGEKWGGAATRHDLLRFARLCHYLRVRRPDAAIGYSIFIYRLSAAELAAATTGSLADWQSLIDHAVTRGAP